MKLDRIGSAVFFLLGAVITRDGLGMTAMPGYDPGPGAFPMLLGSGLMLLSALLFITTRAPDRAFVENSSGFKRAAAVGVSFLVYAFALDYLGLLVALALYLLFLAQRVERKRWREAATIAASGSLACYLLFEVWLHVPLPIGLFGI